MSDFVNGDFVRKDTHAYITCLKKEEKKKRLIKIGIGIVYILLCVISLAVI